MLQFKQTGIAANQQYINLDGDLKRYLEGFTPSADIDWYSRPQELIGQKIGAQYYWIHTDHLGSPHQMSDGNGEVVWSGDYEAFGEFTATEETHKLQIRFPGQYLDKETGMYYNYYRYYDPKVGRYTTADPLGLQGGMNLYAYAGNNPVSFIDPTGEIVPIVIGGIYLSAECVALILASASIVAIWVQRKIIEKYGLDTWNVIISEVEEEKNQKNCTNGECAQAIEEVRAKAADTDPCELLRQSIGRRRANIHKRIEDILVDKCNLFELAYNTINPSLPGKCGTTTFVGHIKAIESWQKGLKNDLTAWQKYGCGSPPKGSNIDLDRRIPTSPRGK